MKSPNHSQGQYNNGSNSLLRNGSFLRRPLSQENSELTNQNAQVYQQSQLNELEKNQHIFNINSHVLALTNQLNHSVSFIARFKIKNHDFFGAIKYQTMESFEMKTLFFNTFKDDKAELAKPLPQISKSCEKNSKVKL